MPLRLSRRTRELRRYLKAFRQDTQRRCYFYLWFEFHLTAVNPVSRVPVSRSLMAHGGGRGVGVVNSAEYESSVEDSRLFTTRTPAIRETHYTLLNVSWYKESNTTCDSRLSGDKQILRPHASCTSQCLPLFVVHSYVCIREKKIPSRYLEYTKVASFDPQKKGFA